MKTLATEVELNSGIAYPRMVQVMDEHRWNLPARDGDGSDKDDGKQGQHISMGKRTRS